MLSMTAQLTGFGGLRTGCLVPCEAVQTLVNKSSKRLSSIRCGPHCVRAGAMARLAARSSTFARTPWTALLCCSSSEPVVASRGGLRHTITKANADAGHWMVCWPTMVQMQVQSNPMPGLMPGRPHACRHDGRRCCPQDPARPYTLKLTVGQSNREDYSCRGPQKCSKTNQAASQACHMFHTPHQFDCC